jgi:hypothetical protein
LSVTGSIEGDGTSEHPLNLTDDAQDTIDRAIVYKDNPEESASPKALLAQQVYVVESDQQILDIVGTAGEINGKGTLFFRITGV